MKTRNFAVKTHLILASALMPFLLIMPLSGVFHLIGIKETTVNEHAFTISDPVPTDTKAKELFFNEQFKINKIDFKFEYIKDTGKELIFRPTSKTYYTAISQPDGLVNVYKSQPNLPKKLIELHKGHGPRLMRTLEIIFGFALIIIALSGVWIALVTKPYRKPMAISFLIGATVILCALF
jgi:hypothetical protein